MADDPSGTSAPRSPIEVVVIGASAGGVQALIGLLSGLPASFALPVVVLLHTPDDRHGRLAEVLDDRLQLPASVARDKEPLAAGHVHVAPGGVHLSIEHDRSFSFSGEAPVNHSRPSIDVLMASAADACGPALAGILLTGASADGAEGLARIRALGGFTVVQDPAEASSPTMPLAAIRRDVPDRVLPLAGIRELLIRWGEQR
jgi:two-component system chemotaxis response regulator CheB